MYTLIQEGTVHITVVPTILFSYKMTSKMIIRIRYILYATSSNIVVCLIVLRFVYQAEYGIRRSGEQLG